MACVPKKKDKKNGKALVHGNHIQNNNNSAITVIRKGDYNHNKGEIKKMKTLVIKLLLILLVMVMIKGMTTVIVTSRVIISILMIAISMMIMITDDIVK